MPERRAPDDVVDGAAWGDRFVALPGAPSTAGWFGVDELFGAELAPTLAAVGAARGTASAAVAGTLLFEQYSQRLVAPVLLAHYRDGAALDIARPLVRAHVVDGRVVRLAFARAPVAPAPAVAVEQLVTDHLGPLASALHLHARIGLRTLRGTMANAVVSTFLHMSWPGPDRSRYADEARSMVARVPEWAGLVNVEAVERGGERWMYTDRGTCCLAFRTTANQAREQRYCGTCPVLPRATTAALFTRATGTYATNHPAAAHSTAVHGVPRPARNG